MALSRTGLLFLFIAANTINSTNTFAQSFIGLNNTENVITETFNNPAFAISNDELQVNAVGFSFLAGTNSYLFMRNGKLLGTG